MLLLLNDITGNFTMKVHSKLFLLLNYMKNYLIIKMHCKWFYKKFILESILL